jgi:predicted RNase H-like nuclease (RuvC/YqgF family)
MMDANEIRKALFPHEETIKRLQEENEALRAQIAELTKPAEQPKEKKRGGDTRKES